FPNLPAIFGLEDVRAHDPMANGRYMGTLRVIAGYDSEAYFAHWRNTDSRLIDFLNVRYLLTDPQVEMKDQQRFHLVYQGKDGRIYENQDVLPRFFVPPNIVLDFSNDSWVRKLRSHDDWAHTTVMHALWVNGDT